MHILILINVSGKSDVPNSVSDAGTETQSLSWCIAVPCEEHEKIKKPDKFDTAAPRSAWRPSPLISQWKLPF